MKKKKKNKNWKKANPALLNEDYQPKGALNSVERFTIPWPESEMVNDSIDILPAVKNIIKKIMKKASETNYTDAQITEITEMAKLQFTPAQIAAIIEVDEIDFIKSWQQTDHPARKAYDRGQLLAEAGVRKQILNMAKHGSTPAINQFLDLAAARENEIAELNKK